MSITIIYPLINCNPIFCRHLGDNSRLVVVKNAGHAANIEKSKEVCKTIVEYFQEQDSSPSTGGSRYIKRLVSSPSRMIVISF